MKKSELLFYDAYEEFYEMAGKSAAFRSFCRDAFGEDFSQDGFSDLSQIDLILQHASVEERSHILDIGCGNGKMLGYLQRNTGAYIHGFDYSEHAIGMARNLLREKSDFRIGVIGEIEYAEGKFDLIISMDTMYFAKDMRSFIGQVKRWMKPDGVLFVGYQEGDVMPRTQDADTTVLAEALRANGMHYEAKEITSQTFELLQKKRKCALEHQTEFEAEGSRRWFELLMMQTEYAVCTYQKFKEKMARYIYVAYK